MTVVRWSDNNVVLCISNLDTVTPEKDVRRRVKGADGLLLVKQPRTIANYTAGVGGVDLMDRLLGARPSVRRRTDELAMVSLKTEIGSLKQDWNAFWSVC